MSITIFRCMRALALEAGEEAEVGERSAVALSLGKVPLLAVYGCFFFCLFCMTLCTCLYLCHYLFVFVSLSVDLSTHMVIDR